VFPALGGKVPSPCVAVALLIVAVQVEFTLTWSPTL